jgi:hypothetical protein
MEGCSNNSSNSSNSSTNPNDKCIIDECILLPTVVTITTIHDHDSRERCRYWYWWCHEEECTIDHIVLCRIQWIIVFVFVVHYYYNNDNDNCRV